MFLVLSLLLACSSEDEATPASTPAEVERDACCDPGEPGEARWESCEDQTVLSHVCKRAEICCTVQWAEPCAAGYARFAATCEMDGDTKAAVGAGSSASAGPSGEAPSAADAVPGQLEPPRQPGELLTSLEGVERVKVVLKVDMKPVPETPGGHIFYGGFTEIDETVGMPKKNSRPSDYGSVAQWVQDFPVEAELELYDGLHYFVMYGFGDHPQPGDRMAPLQQVSGAGEMSYLIDARRIPKEGEVPEGGFAPGSEPEGPPGVLTSDEEPPPPPPGAPPPDDEPPTEPEDPETGG